MKPERASTQPDLFDQEKPGALPSPLQREQLATLVKALLFEIAVARANGEVGDEQDHG